MPSFSRSSKPQDKPEAKAAPKGEGLSGSLPKARLSMTLPPPAPPVAHPTGRAAGVKDYDALRRSTIQVTPRFATLAHVGNLDQPRESKGISFEGAGLSVSLHPEAWTSIAKLGGYQTWVIRKSEPAFYEVPSAPSPDVLSWCREQGYIESATKFRVSWYDSEMDSEVSMELDTREEAEAEMDDDREMEVFQGWKFGPAGMVYWKLAFGSSPVRHNFAEDYASIFWAEAQGYDGCWWEDNLDPTALSAPRGVIFQSKLDEWTKGLGGWESPVGEGTEDQEDDDY